MRRLLPRSLRWRLTLAILGALAVALTVTLLTGAALVHRSVERDDLEALSRQADLLAAKERIQPTPPGRIADLGLFLATERQSLAIVSLERAAFLLPERDGEELLRGNAVDGTLELRGSQFLYAASPVDENAVVMLRPASDQASDWTPFLVAFLIAGLVGAALAAGLAFLLARTVARPIARVADATRRFAAGEESKSLPVAGSTEVATLAEAFNDMARKLTRARRAERSFLLSVSHELRTPLTVVRGHAEALAERVVSPGEAAEVIAHEAVRLERLVQDLLDLARLDQRTFRVELASVDLAEVARIAERRYAGQARALSVSLDVVAPDPAPARGDPDRVLQALSNLVENALRCTPAGGIVTITARPGELLVADTGSGIPPDDLPRAFERFFLYERNTAHRGVGTGLGLAIVRELTEAMGGTAAIESRPGRGTTFRITLPREPSTIPTALTGEPAAVSSLNGKP